MNQDGMLHKDKQRYIVKNAQKAQEIIFVTPCDFLILFVTFFSDIM
jgi:hypothetical protein